MKLELHMRMPCLKVIHWGFQILQRQGSVSWILDFDSTDGPTKWTYKIAHAACLENVSPVRLHNQSNLCNPAFEKHSQFAHRHNYQQINSQPGHPHGHRYRSQPVGTKLPNIWIKQVAIQHAMEIHEKARTRSLPHTSRLKNKLRFISWYRFPWFPDPQPREPSPATDPRSAVPAKKCMRNCTGM